MATTIEDLALTVRRLERIRRHIRQGPCEFEEPPDPETGHGGERSCRQLHADSEEMFVGGPPCGPCLAAIAASEEVVPRLYAARRRLRAALDRKLAEDQPPVGLDGRRQDKPMRRELRWVYWCEWCRKSGRSPGAMAKHQNHCTANPRRECGVCDAVGIGRGQPVAAAVEVLGKGTAVELDALREFCDGCPACMLAAIRQSKLEDDIPSDLYDHRGWKVPGRESWRYETEKERFWDAVNDSEACR